MSRWHGRTRLQREMRKMENEKPNKPRNYRHCGVPCCGTCRWFTRLYEDRFCEHPKNVIDLAADYVVRPLEDDVCGWWEEKEG